MGSSVPQVLQVEGEPSGGQSEVGDEQNKALAGDQPSQLEDRSLTQHIEEDSHFCQKKKKDSHFTQAKDAMAPYCLSSS